MSNCSSQGITGCQSTSTWATCKPWQITEQTRTTCYADSLIQETLSIAGADVYVYKLLGVYEQTKLTDVTGRGEAIASSFKQGFEAAQAFNTFRTEWRSAEAGDKVISDAFIGYDFGVMRISNGRTKYRPDADIRVMITSIKIKQSVHPQYRISKARIERSDGGKLWYGVSVVSLPVDDGLHTVHFKQSVPSRFWRIRPVAFVGGHCDVWGVQAIEMSEYAATDISNIQDFVWLENRDREYNTNRQLIKGYYELITTATDLTRFGYELPTQEYQIRINFNACVQLLGRPIVIGDIIELPSETQYTAALKPVRKFLEVTDITWDSSSYTPGWMPLNLLVTAAPAMASQETRNIFGDLASIPVDNSGLLSGDDGNNTGYQDTTAIDHAIRSSAKMRVPETGSEGSNIRREFTDSELKTADEKGYTSVHKLQFNRTELYVEDAIPQNGAPFTEGPEYPEHPNDGEYHRLTYEGTASDIPTKLYRWSKAKGRWIYLETDRRSLYNASKAAIDEYTTSPTKQPSRTIE